MKRVLIIVLAALVALPLTSFSLGFLSVQNATITQIGTDTYRLRVNMDWGGPDILAGDFVAPTGATLVTDARVNLSAFELGGPAGGFNYFAEVNEGIWGPGQTSGWGGTDYDRYEYWRPLGYEFGYDFQLAGALPQTMQITYGGWLEWAYTYRTAGGLRSFDWYDIAHDEYIRGSYQIGFVPVPEPTTALLFGIGVIGATLVGRRRAKK